MSDLTFNAAAIIARLDDGDAISDPVFHAEVLFFPEASVLAPRRPRVNLLLARHLKEILKRTPLGDIFRRRRSAEPLLGQCRLTLDPPRSREIDDPDTTVAPSIAWIQPVELCFDVVRWSHGDHAAIAFVPALGIEVIGADDAELDLRLPFNIRAALLRQGAGKSLRKLAELQRISSIELHPLELDIAIRSPKKVATDADREPAEQPVIEQVGIDLTRQTLPRSWELEKKVAALADNLTGRNPRSVLLIGKAGVGKTSMVHELVRNREALQLGQTPFWATSGARLVAGMTGFGMWQQRCQRLCREASKAQAILYLGNLIELMDVGRSTHNAQGIASFMRPYIGRGELLAIAECTPEQLVILERQDPATLGVFTRLEIEEPTPEVSRTILLHELLASDPTEPSPMDDGALNTVDAIHRRYATYSAFPARPVRFVRNLLRDRSSAHSAKTITRSDVLAAFARETGLPLMLLDEKIPLDIPKTQRWFGSRVIGQTEAVNLVCELIATVKAVMSRPRRPIASLLFIGPTGVGKTEMAKALAEYFFGDPTRLVRFDMSEYATPAAVERLVGGAGHLAEGLLTSRVREQPFSVILLDEFEKAHPAFFDLMLQVLGEGRLTDASGRVADFGNAVVVMTSNLGAQSFQQNPFGLRPQLHDGGASSAKQHFIESVRDHFRPEMFNRIDRVVPFVPLNAEMILCITRRELELVRRRDGIKLRGVELEISDDAVDYLADRGFDSRYGARPLKRAIERELLVPLGESLNSYAEDAKLVARATMEAGKLAVVVRAAGDGRPAGPASELVFAAGNWSTLRRRLQMLERSAAVTGMRNEQFTLQRLKQRLEALALARFRAKEKTAKQGSFFVHVDDDPRLARMPRLKEVSDALSSLVSRVTDAETTALLAIAGDVPPLVNSADQLTAFQAEWNALLLSVYSLRFGNPDRVALTFFGQNSLYVYDLARAYMEFAIAHGSDVQISTFQARPRNQWKVPAKAEHDRVILESDLQKRAAFFDQRRSVAAISLTVRGPHAYARFAGERGMQAFQEDGKIVGIVQLDIQSENWNQSTLPADAARVDQLDPKDARRTYDLTKNVVEDKQLKQTFRWTGRQWTLVIAEAAEAQLFRDTEAIVGDGVVLR